MASKKKILKDGFVIESGYTADGGFVVNIPTAAFDLCVPDSKEAIQRVMAEFLLAADIPEHICPKEKIRSLMCECK